MKKGPFAHGEEAGAGSPAEAMEGAQHRWRKAWQTARLIRGGCVLASMPVLVKGCPGRAIFMRIPEKSAGVFICQKDFFPPPQN